MERLTEEQKALAEESVGRAKGIAERYARIFPNHKEDLKSHANMGAVRAALGFEPERNGVWERWLGLHIHGEIKNFLGELGSDRFRAKPQEELQEIECGSNDLLAHDSAESLSAILGLLPQPHRELCSMVYELGKSPSDAGAALGYGARHGRKLHSLSIRFLRERLGFTGLSRTTIGATNGDEADEAAAEASDHRRGDTLPGAGRGDAVSGSHLEGLDHDASADARISDAGGRGDARRAG